MSSISGSLDADSIRGVHSGSGISLADLIKIFWKSGSRVPIFENSPSKKSLETSYDYLPWDFSPEYFCFCLAQPTLILVE